MMVCNDTELCELLYRIRDLVNMGNMEGAAKDALEVYKHILTRAIKEKLHEQETRNSKR